MKYRWILQSLQIHQFVDLKVKTLVANKNTNIFKALSELNRLRILKLLQSEPLYVTEITEALGLAASTVSAHLHILLNSGFVLGKKEGKWIKYSISTFPSDKRVSAIISKLDFWIADVKIR